MSRDQDPGAAVRSFYAAEGGARAAFSERAADYASARPGYPEALFQTLKVLCPPVPGVLVADIGAGTGLFTQGLLSHGYRVIAVEPNPRMRQAADRLLGGIEGYRSVEGCAEAIPLEPASADLVAAAHAFHWFEAERARAEFLRVLKPQGQAVVLWNDRVVADEFNAALDEMFARLGGAKRAALVAHERDRSYLSRFFNGVQPKQFSWPHRQRLDQEAFLSLVFSRSYIPTRNTPEGREAANRTLELFRRFASGGILEVRYQTVAMVGRPG